MILNRLLSGVVDIFFFYGYFSGKRDETISSLNKNLII